MIMKRASDDYYLTYLKSFAACYGDVVEVPSELYEEYQRVWDAMHELQDKLDKLEVVVATK